MSKALRVVLDDFSGVERYVDDLTLAQLIATEPNADKLLQSVRAAIGQKIKAERLELDLSLEEVRDFSNKEIDSAGLSRLERGLAWSHELAAKAIDFLAVRRADRRKASNKERARNGKRTARA